MKLAIVGTTIMMTDNEYRDTEQYMAYLLNSQRRKVPELIITGGAIGVDTMVMQKATLYNIPLKVMNPEEHGWKQGYKDRNLKIAQECDELICITTKAIHTRKCYHHTPLGEHQKTAGCWTLDKAKELNKPTTLFLI